MVSFVILVNKSVTYSRLWSLQCFYMEGWREGHAANAKKVVLWNKWKRKNHEKLAAPLSHGKWSLKMHVQTKFGNIFTRISPIAANDKLSGLTHYQSFKSWCSNSHSLQIYHNKKLSYRQVTAWCVLSVAILPITTQQCRNYLYDKSWPNRWYEVGSLVGGNVSNKPTTVELCISPVYRWLAVAKFSKSTV